MTTPEIKCTVCGTTEVKDWRQWRGKREGQLRCNLCDNRQRREAKLIKRKRKSHFDWQGW